MKGFADKAGVAFVLLFFAFSRPLFAAASLAAEQEGAPRGYWSETNREAILSKAKKEGAVRGLLGVDPGAIKLIKERFGKKYPFLSVHFEEITGSDNSQRLLLELAAGRGGDWDVIYLSVDHYREYAPYLEKVDLLGMARRKVLSIPPAMVSPQDRNAVSMGVFTDVAAYNVKMLKPAEVPATWEDFLKPELKGKKFVTDIKPSGLAGLVPVKGMEWVLGYARKLAAQDPVWARGQTRVLTAMTNGEYALTLSTYYSTVMRAKKRGAVDLEPIFLEPIPVRLGEPHAIVKGARRPHAALLLLEYMAGPEGQDIIDEADPGKASVFAPGSMVEKVIAGRKLSVFDWEHFARRGEYSSEIFKALGFPKADRGK
ncbi:MAG TPA: extracellular solute-binding protein [Candidatus Acidoferrales bacterium]|nr:extracellular solute-binding protein [Candidatus Acidoferrales bacterium]